MNKPLVSVVMVVRNVDRFVAESIDSVLGQTFKNFEFIILDFGSTDKSKAIVSNYAARDSRIRMHEIPNCGLAVARNASCALARGQYIAMVDADDVCLPDRLLWQIEFMERHPGVGLLGGAMQWIDAKGRFLFINGGPTEDHEIRSALAFRNPFGQNAVMIRRDTFTFVGGYRAVFAQTEDYDLWLRISEHFQCANLKQVVVKYRVHPNQESFRKRRQQTLCFLAAQVSALFRGKGKPDPLESVQEITPALLMKLGVSEGRQQTAIASDLSNWIRNMRLAGEYSVALQAAVEFLRSSDLEQADGRPIADLWLAAAWLYWKRKQFLNSLFALGHAVMARPVVVGRPLKLLLRRFELE
jgi:glycosyltransferase involved in cell wall biosynthesis